ncbi:uncharacterized protein LOC124256807 [Haliotis rubra]|uniref:uncharacterized protein LOC124256807 n=1 Tax=Haliotis rubra TaxID=36100 RepID=UPI001EE5465A|nr:uncharacterized protein LOC124256807 [Haliotis rubra]
MESLTNRFENIDVWKTEIETLEPSKIRQDAKDATRGVEGCLKKVDTLMQDVGSISINVTSVNTTVSELAHIVTAVVTRLAELDARERRIADTGDATRKMAEDAEKAAAENARCVQELSFEVKSITTKMAGINSTMSTMYQAMNESTALLMSWKTEISEKELPMIKQNITDDRKLLEEARQNASESSGLLQGHILWAIHTSLDFKKRINEILKREEEFKDEHDSVKREVETLKNVSKVLGFDVANLQENVSSLQHLAESVRTQVFSNVDKLEAVTQSVGNITSNITAINITSEDLSSQLSATKQSVKSLASWRNELVLTELPTLKQYIDVVHQEVEQVQRNTSTNGDLIKAHIVWANWTYVEFQKHRNATNKKVAEFAGKHDTTDRKLDGEELDGAMTKAELSQLKGKSTFHAEVRSTLAETRTNLTETNPKFGKLEDRINKLKETQNNLMEIVIPGIESKVGDIRGKAIEAKEATEENGGRLKEYFKQSNSAYEEFKKHRDATNRKVAEFAGKHVAAERKLDGEELDGAMTKAELSQLKGKSTLHAEVRSTLAETRTLLTETNTKFGKLEDRINKLNETQNNLMEVVLPGIESKMGDIRGKAIEAKEATEENGGRLKEYIKQSNSAYEEFKKHRDATNKKVEEFAGKHDTAERKLDGEELDGAMTKAELSQLKGKSTLHDIALYLTLLNIIAVVIVVMYVRQTLSSSSAPVSAPVSAPAAFHNNTQRGFRREEVYELSWAGPMEGTLCVVTFHTETELKHADQTRSVFESVQQPCPTIHTRVIRCHADIKELPGSRVFLVFVDFNERNVILEDPTKGLGDLRVTTVRSLWKFGADVAVIYCGDGGSANLGGGLFNQDLGSIHRQKELTQLKKDDRILSISSDFNNTQKQHCRNYINRLLHIAH